MIALFSCEFIFNFVSFLLYPTEVKMLKCAMLGAFTVIPNGLDKDLDQWVFHPLLFNWMSILLHIKNIK